MDGSTETEQFVVEPAAAPALKPAA
jgi:hypothetical protein